MKHNKSNSSRKSTNYILKFSIFSLVYEYIILFIFYPFFLSYFTESQHLIKINALTLTFDVSSSNHFLNFLKYIL